MLERMPPRSLWTERSSSRQTLGYLLVILLLVLFAAQLIRVARLYSANWDEAHHLYDGYRVLTAKDYRLNAEVPPLVKMAAALPLLPLHPALPAAGANAFVEGRLFVFGNGGDRLLFPARMMCMIFPLLTALLIYAAARHLSGGVAGLVALLLFVFDPNILAHGTLISTDLGSACFIFATLFAYYRYSSAPGWRWLLITGFLAGLAMVTKFTGILIAPMLFALAIGEAIQNRSFALFGRRVMASIAILLCAWAVIWTFYGYRYAPAAPGLELSPAFGSYLTSLPNKADGATLALLARFHALPQAYLWGLANTKHTEWEYTSYFFGRLYRHGPWQYFPTAFLIKSTLPLLLLLALVPVAYRTWPGGQRRQLLFLLVPVAVYFAVVTHSHFDIGARHLMPIYPFLYVLAGTTAATFLPRGMGWATAVIALAAWQILTCTRAAPNYMAYGNEAWGGPLQVRRYLSDANVDWGQQLKTVKAYLDENHITNCWFAYFPDGAVQPQDYGIHCHRLPTPSGLWWIQLPMEVPPVIEGTVLISESDLDGVESGDGPLNPYDAFRTRKPDAILQDGVYVYRGTFAVPLASAWVAIRKSGELAQAGDEAGALRSAQTAVSLAPQSTRAQLNLADGLLAQHEPQQALAHYKRAQLCLQQERPDLQGEELLPRILNGLRATESH